MKWIVCFVLTCSLSILVVGDDLIAQCSTDISICSSGQAGPFTFVDPGATDISSCLTFAGDAYGYITLFITESGPLEMLIEGDDTDGILDVSIYNVPSGIDPCEALNDINNEIGCHYADEFSGCNQFGNYFPCASSVPAPIVNAGDILMIVVEDWLSSMTEYTLELAPSPSAQSGFPIPTITSPLEFCNDISSTQLTTSIPGGTWSGPGVSPSGNFDPSSVGQGTYSITYSIGTFPCEGSVTESVTVTNCDSPPCCTYTAILDDAGGDGWDGSEVSVTVNGVIIATETVVNTTNQFTFTSCLGENLQVEYTSEDFHTTKLLIVVIPFVKWIFP